MFFRTTDYSFKEACMLVVGLHSTRYKMHNTCRSRKRIVDLTLKTFTVKYRVMTSQKTFFFSFQRFEYHLSIEHDDKHPQPKLYMAAWISSIEISVNWPGFEHIWTRAIYTVFNGLISYSCGHMRPIYAKFDVWGFFIMFFWNMFIKW